MAVLWKDPLLVRRRLVDRTGQVAGYRVHAAVPDGSHDPPTLDAIDEEYRTTDLVALAEQWTLALDATPALLASADHLLHDVPHPLLEVPRWMLDLPDVPALMADLRDQGTALALGGFTGAAPQEDVLDLVDAVMVDADDPDLDALLATCAGTPVVACGATSRSALDHAIEAGADLAEAQWVFPDDERHAGDLVAEEMQCLELLALLDQHPADPGQVAEIISASPELSVAVLRQVNSSAVALRHRVDSVRHATVLVGPRRLRTIAVSALSGARHGHVDALWAVLSRAWAVSELTGRDAGYTAGLLSGLADVRQFPLDWLADRAGVSDQVRAALLSRRGRLGTTVAAVAAYEAGDLERVEATGLDPWVVSRAVLEAVVRSQEILPDLT